MTSSDPNIYSLSASQLQLYEDNGYIVIKNFIDQASLQKYKERFHQVCNGTVEKGEILIINETKINRNISKNGTIVNKLHDVHFDNVFATYTEHPSVVNVMKQLVGSELRVISSMYINKEPGSVAHPPHQDLAYFAIRPAHKIAGIWTAIDTVTRDNGALFVLPGSHKSGLIYEHGHDPNANKACHTILDETVIEGKKKVVLEMAPGDTVFFHPLLIHGSKANITQHHPRNSISAHYASEQTYFVEVCGGPLATVASDMEQVARGRGWNVTYENILRYRSKPINTRPRSRI